ncbi:uncharacterized protein LOC128223805 isoform X2 [Mya arenaria]|nr:uncharacterized protein LOC128223805 isoform X2 [Mya arenaria]XP_052789203.1 uncharacterized protein LOC128223805 isoform X2 [Mya arenaria]
MAEGGEEHQHLGMNESHQSEEDGKKEIAEESTGIASSEQILRSNHTDLKEFGIQVYTSPDTASLPTPTATHISHHLPANDVVQSRRIIYNKKACMQYTSNGKPLYIGKCEDGYMVVVKEAENSDESDIILEIDRRNNKPIVAKLKYQEKHGDTFVMAFAPCNCNIIDHINSLPINDRASTYILIKDMIMKVKRLHVTCKVCHGDIAYGNIWISVKDDDVQVMLAGLGKASNVNVVDIQAGHSYGSHPFLDDIKGLRLTCYMIMHILANNGVTLDLKYEDVDFEAIKLLGDGMTGLYHCIADLLRIMINDPGMSLADLKKHPSFWEAYEFLYFIKRVKSNLGYQQDFEVMHSKKIHVFNMLGVDNWKKNFPTKDRTILESPIVNEELNLKDYDGERISGLIKFIRNADGHFYDNCHLVRVFESCPSGLVQYINEKFPKLFIYLYRHSQSKRKAGAKK